MFAKHQHIPLGFIQVLSLLEQSGFKFQLTGSRYFGNYGINSDYDFFVQDDGKLFTKNDSLREFLLDLKFKLIQGGTSYLDPITVSVYRFSSGGLQIDVQIVTNYDLKRKAQIILGELGILGYIPDKNKKKRSLE